MASATARTVTLETLSAELNWYAAENHLSNAALARRAEMPEATIRRLRERKAKELKSEHAQTIGRLLGRPTDQVIELFAEDRHRAGTETGVCMTTEPTAAR